MVPAVFVLMPAVTAPTLPVPTFVIVAVVPSRLQHGRRALWPGLILRVFLGLPRRLLRELVETFHAIN